MAVYRKKLVDKDGNTIIPAVGDIYGTVYTATLSSATAGGRADYDFTPDTPVENNKVYAVQFPDPTVNNATIILGDGVSSGSILVPPVAATDSPNYELLTTDMINDTEPLLLMYNGVQWVCLNQNKKVATADLENGAVTTNKIDWTTLTYFAKNGSDVSIGTGETTVITINNLKPGTYLVFGVLSLNKTSPEAGDAFIGLKYDGKSERICQISMTTSYGWVYPPAVGMAQITLTGNSVQLFAQRPSSIASMLAMKNGSLLLINIG